jgi:hypothetical protein
LNGNIQRHLCTFSDGLQNIGKERIIETAKPAISLAGDSQKEETLYEKNCAACSLGFRARADSGAHAKPTPRETISAAIQQHHAASYAA